eukprot:gb/GFBE01017362.1/.p1 GENE.gb/GFBE01017362.1/~~gb/GFBE01017362.1/.p1  ORF type:complete len:318 (+),score=69.79 gb/GFBE01017362.1/:1-954(+)
MRWLLLVSCASALAGFARAKVDDDDDYKDDSKACSKWYPAPVEHICHENFPKPTTEKLWIMLFSSHSCYKCKFLVDTMVKLAKEFKNDPSIGVGVVNCYWRKNYRELCHPKHKVESLPSLRIIENGKFLTYSSGIDQTAEGLERLVRQKLAARAQCASGVFTSTSAAQPLCSGRFPQQGDKQKWLVVYYSKTGAASGNLESVVNTLAEALGHSDEEKITQRDRLVKLARAHDVEVKLPKHGLTRKEPLANVGAVCCDCTPKDQSFCKQQLGDDATLPTSAWVVDGELREVQVIQESVSELVEYALSNLGFVTVQEEL